MAAPYFVFCVLIWLLDVERYSIAKNSTLLSCMEWLALYSHARQAFLR